MTDRAAKAEAFLVRYHWGKARRAPLAGDASNRRYDRLIDIKTGQSAVLMDAPPEQGEDVRPFIRIARHLKQLGLSSPSILAEDTQNGFLILEDLGDALYSKVIPKDPGLERLLYETATDVLVSLHAAPMIALDAYDPPMMAQMSGLAYRKYAAFSETPQNADAEDRFVASFADLLRRTVTGPSVLIQRDYHADNLLWLPKREGVARVGLLDFQDAMAGHPAYDLVSLLQDVRRDVSAEIENAMIARYVAATSVDPNAFRETYNVLGAQRAMRILGVFARLGKEYGRPHYVDMIPKVWNILNENLRTPALAPIAQMVLEAVPAPSTTLLAELKRK